MASLVKRGETFSVRYKDRDGNSKKIALGVNDEKRARVMLGHIEELVEAVRTDSRPARATEAWANKQEESLQLRLEKAGLIELGDKKAKHRCTLGPFLDGYVTRRSDVKGATATFYGHTVRNLKEFFGPNQPMAKITPGDADDFKSFLQAEKTQQFERGGRVLHGQALSINTVNRRCSLAGQFFISAKRKRLVAENPFEGVGGAVRSNKARMYYISAEDAGAVLDACPDAEWRLIFALSRFGGLRTPSEQDGLRWEDINWARNRIFIRSSKTEHHEGRESRWMPIFPELRPYLEQAWTDAPAGAEFVLQQYRGRANLRTRFRKIIKRAGLTPWQKLFQNLRSTRETELCNQGYPMHVVCYWLGNKPKVAHEHYMQVRDADYDLAANGRLTNGTKIGTSDLSIRQQSTANAIPGTASSYEDRDVSCFIVGDTGLELSPNCREREAFSEEGHENGTSVPSASTLTADLAAVAEAWPKLPAATRQAVLNLIDRATREEERR